MKVHECDIVEDDEEDEDVEDHLISNLVTNVTSHHLESGTNMTAIYTFRDQNDCFPILVTFNLILIPQHSSCQPKSIVTSSVNRSF